MSTTRRQFLRRAGALIGGLTVAPALLEAAPASEAAETELAPARVCCRSAAEERASERLAGSGVLVSTGGLCAPVTPYYTMILRCADCPPSSPIRDALPAFRADRGGIGYRRP